MIISRASQKVPLYRYSNEWLIQSIILGVWKSAHRISSSPFSITFHKTWSRFAVASSPMKDLDIHRLAA
jgi:hypothetical protein